MIRSQFHWLIALAGGFSLVVAAVTVADRPAIPEPPKVHDVQQLGTVFRQVSQQALPCVVTVMTTEKASSRGIDEQIPERFQDLFGGDPRFREFFRQLPRQQAPREGMGSGFIIDPSGIIVTNNHVVAAADEILIRLHDGREFRGTDVKTDPRTDVAIVRIDAGAPLPSLKFGNSDAMEVGDWVIAVGNPFGQELTVTSGIVSAKGRGPGIAEREDFIQTDAAINPGNSGGPLLNLSGEVIGMNTAISSRSGGFDGIGFAVPSRMAWWVVNQLVEKGEVNRAYLGIGIQQMTNDLARQFGLKVGEGAVVIHVSPDSPAAAAKLNVGDVILSLNGQAVTSPRSLQAIVEQLDVDHEYQADVLRDGERVKLPITLKAMPAEYTLSRVMSRQRERQDDQRDQPLSVDHFGFAVQDLTAEVAEQLGIDADQKGVVVSEVDADGPAGRKLAVGDVIQRVGRRAVTSTQEFHEALKSANLRNGLVLLVNSGNSPRFIAIEPKKEVTDDAK